MAYLLARWRLDEWRLCDGRVRAKALRIEPAISIVKGDADPALRETEMDFVPKIQGISIEYLVEIRGERGNCYIASAGSMPEREFTFYYIDSKYEFCFYATQKWDDNIFDVDIFNATAYRFHGPTVRVAPEDIEYIKSNISEFFRTRDFYSSRKPINPRDKFRNLTISGGLV